MTATPVGLKEKQNFCRLISMLSQHWPGTGWHDVPKGGGAGGGGGGGEGGGGGGVEAQVRGSAVHARLHPLRSASSCLSQSHLQLLT